MSDRLRHDMHLKLPELDRQIERGEAVLLIGRQQPSGILITFLLLVSAGMLLPSLLNALGVIEVHWRGGRVMSQTESLIWFLGFGTILTFVAIHQFAQTALAITASGLVLGMRGNRFAHLPRSSVSHVSVSPPQSRNHVQVQIKAQEHRDALRPLKIKQSKLTLNAGVSAAERAFLRAFAPQEARPIYVHNGFAKTALKEATGDIHE